LMEMDVLQGFSPISSNLDRLASEPLLSAILRTHRHPAAFNVFKTVMRQGANSSATCRLAFPDSCASTTVRRGVGTADGEDCSNR
jgi:hypothetical protein